MREVAISVLLLVSIMAPGQDTISSLNITGTNKTLFSGFIRSSFYLGFDGDDNSLTVSSAGSDAVFKVKTGSGNSFSALTDIRFRYGSEFGKQVNRINIREAYTTLISKKWDLSVGQKVIKWGRADFTNPTSKLCPQDLLSRSPDPEDMDLGNLLTEICWYPARWLNIKSVLVPFYRSSVLLIRPLPIPDFVTINEIENLLSDKKFSYGIKADFHIRGLDWGFSMFDGYDPMPGVGLKKFNLDITGPVPIPNIELEMKPYRTRVLGLDYEATAGMSGFRGEAALTIPYLKAAKHEYVPLPDIKWVTGIDWSSGKFNLTAEYSGQLNTDFTRVQTAPLLASESDMGAFAGLMTDQEFDPVEYVRAQVASFNRLYNYQIERVYHRVAFRAGADFMYGRLLPSVFTTLNLTSGDFYLAPEIKYKPNDGILITAGAGYYSGMKGSLFDLINDFLNSIYLAVRIEF